MKKIYFERNVELSNLNSKKLITYLGGICDYITFSIHLNNYNLSISEYSKALDDYYTYYNDDKLKEYGIGGFDELKKELKKYINTILDPSAPLNEPISISKYHCESTKFTLGTHCTVGGFYKEYKFQLNDDMINTLLDAGNLYTTFSFFSINALQDPAFYSNERLICSICSHEIAITLFLKNEEYEEFCTFDIPHKSYNSN